MTTNLGHIEAASIKTQVYLRLREALFTGLFLPGESLTIRSLANMLGTSPMPVREALQRLVAEHAFTQMPNRTFRVTPFTSDMFRELVQIRMAVEGLAARQASQRMTLQTLNQMQNLNDQMIHGIEQQNPTKIMSANRKFHFTLYHQAEMPQLIDIINGLWLRAGPYLANTHRKLSDPLPFFRTGALFHERIINACKASRHHDVSRATACDIWYSARYFRLNIALINEPDTTTTNTQKRREK